MAMHYWVHLVSGTTIAREAQIGAKLYLPHSGNIIIHPGCSIGDNCSICHEVTLGTSLDKAGVPRLGNNVFVGPGAKLLGPITIGDGARIAGNSLVISDVPAGAVAIGVPARALPAPPPSYLR
jgi:serine O-acetyltransferase